MACKPHCTSSKPLDLSDYSSDLSHVLLHFTNSKPLDLPHCSSSKHLDLSDCLDLQNCSSYTSHVLPHCSSTKSLDVLDCSDLKCCSSIMSHVCLIIHVLNL